MAWVRTFSPLLLFTAWPNPGHTIRDKAPAPAVLRVTLPVLGGSGFFASADDGTDKPNSPAAIKVRKNALNNFFIEK